MLLRRARNFLISLPCNYLLLNLASLQMKIFVAGGLKAKNPVVLEDGQVNLDKENNRNPSRSKLDVS